MIYETRPGVIPNSVAMSLSFTPFLPRWVRAPVRTTADSCSAI